jgi:hypothetical protein
MEKKYSLENAIAKDLRAKASSGRFEELANRQQDTATLFQAIDRHIHHREHSSGGLYGVICFILFGMLGFFAALIFDVFINQNDGVRITFIICVAIMAIALGWIEKRAHSQVWDKVRGGLADEEAVIGELDI